MKILIVDDSKAMRMLVRRALREAGYGDHDYAEAQNGKEALEILRAGGVDLALLDWNMPEMTGIEVLAKVKELGLRTKCAMITTEASPDMQTRAHAEGALFVVGKPFSPEVIERELRRVFG
jgi:two-component system chemotaxis response regulator CheY